MARMTARAGGPLKGRARVPSDKSMSHRALLLGAIAQGTTRVSGLLEAEDVLGTGAALRAFGISIERRGGHVHVEGGPWRQPPRTLDLGNAGTGVRLLMGLAAGMGVNCRFTGDPSLRRRPMGRVIDPLTAMGAKIDAADGKRLPAALTASTLGPFRYELPVPSAQVKSAVLLAGVGARQPVTVVEAIETRDHTERMLTAFGADISKDGDAISYIPAGNLTGISLGIPADPSSAAFPMVAALIAPGSEIRLDDVMLNPRRAGLLATLERMGATIGRENPRTIGGEEVADLVITHGPLRGIEVPAADIPDMIDEIPVLAVAAAFAKGRTRIEGLCELKVKESDRLAATAKLLKSAGVTCETGDDWLEIDGQGGKVRGGGEIETDHDHRIGMAALVLGIAAQSPMAITGAEAIGSSFPGFAELMNGLGAGLETA